MRVGVLDAAPQHPLQVAAGEDERPTQALSAQAAAPALMEADVGAALGGGTDIAIESADIIIVNNRLESVMLARDISRHSHRKTKQNVTLASLFNGVGIPIAATGLLYPV